MLLEYMLFYKQHFYEKCQAEIVKNQAIAKQHLEAVDQKCSVKKVFLEISQNSQENTCARVFF